MVVTDVIKTTWETGGSWSPWFAGSLFWACSHSVTAWVLGGLLHLGLDWVEAQSCIFPPVEAHSSILALTFGYLFFPCSFFFSSLFSSVPWNLVVFHFGGQEVSYGEWSELSGAEDILWTQISERANEWDPWNANEWRIFKKFGQLDNNRRGLFNATLTGLEHS